MPSLSIITVAFNSAHLLPQFVRAARIARSDAEVIVVDNASADASREIVASHPGVSVVPSPTNLGFGRACNLGAERASSELLLFANPDVTILRAGPEPNALPSPLGLRVGHLTDASDRSTPALKSDPMRLGQWYAEVFARLRPSWVPRVSCPLLRRPYAVGALLLVSSDEFHAVGGFDQRYFLYHEDRDLSRRFRDMQLPVGRIPDLEGRHLEGASSSSDTSVSGQSWSLVSWLEYVGIWEGQAAADELAERVVAVLRTMSDQLGRLGRMSRFGGALRRKAAEYEAVLRFVTAFDKHLPPDAQDVYPHAAKALRLSALSPQ